MPSHLLASTDQLRALDHALMNELQLTTAELMEIAGAGVFLLIRALAETSGRVVVVAGPGQNGGDGFVVARYAAAAGIPTSVHALRAPADLTPARAQMDRLARCEVPVSFADLAALERALADPAALVVDALFGTGLRQPLGAAAIQWIEAVNRARGTVVSIDLPSGLDGDSGEAPSGSVRAARTLTIGAVKPGLLTAGGMARSGLIDVVPLPYPPSLTRDLRRVEPPQSN